MRLATVRSDGATAAVRVEDDGQVLLPYTDLGALLADPDGLEVAAAVEGPVNADSVFAPPVLSPSKVICVGLNYKSHIEESGEAAPRFPTLFNKFGDSLIGAADALALPAESEKVDWEAELVVVIGRTARRIDPRQAEEVIAGFTVGNDISMRDFQGRTSQWLQGKAFDASTPVGPVLLTVDQCGPRPDLGISCSVNGVTKQSSRTSDLLFGVPELISYISGFTTLRPGDLVFTGTPGGVGQSQRVPEFLRSGDVLETTIELIGSCRNVCVDQATDPKAVA